MAFSFAGAFWPLLWLMRPTEVAIIGAAVVCLVAVFLLTAPPAVLAPYALLWRWPTGMVGIAALFAGAFIAESVCAPWFRANVYRSAIAPRRAVHSWAVPVHQDKERQP